MSVRALPPALAEKARVELNEDPKRLNDDIQHLKDWVAKQPHLRARTDDQWLVAFLRGCKFSLERAKEKLDLFYSIKSTAPELYKIKHSDPKFTDILNTGYLLILPKLISPDSPRITLMRPGKYDADKYTIIDVSSVSNIIQQLLLINDDNTVVAGGVAILDLQGVTMGHFLQMTPTTMKKMVVAGQDAMPFRMKGVHFVNAPQGFETIFNTMKALLNEKNRARLNVHTDYDSLYKHIPKEVLPVEYGGNGGTTEEIVDYWKKKVQEYDDFLTEDQQYGTDESKRPGKPRTAEDMFGAEGSFRKLDVD